MNWKKAFSNYVIPVITWAIRLSIGATFIISGFSKMIDIWGFTYKIEQYINVWGWEITRPIVVIAAMSISAIEFVLGCMLATGCYKRSSSWIATFIMLIMLPLSAYIMIENPVDDCGCFGDFWVISNSATFFKNIAITIGLIYLCIFNKRTFGLFLPYLQWIVATICYIYILIIGFLGYNIQPLVDFRSYKVGTEFIPKNSSDNITFNFIYEKTGIKQSFDIDSLPDSTWTFVERTKIGSDSTTNHSITIYDLNNNDVTSEVITNEGEQIILLFPEIKYADISYSFMTNEMDNYIKNRGGELIGIFATNDKKQIKDWVDRSLIQWPIYTAEDTSIKEIARGKGSVVYLKDGIIQWKRTLSSIPTDIFSISNSENAFEQLYPKDNHMMRHYSSIFICSIIIIFTINLLFVALTSFFSRICKKKNVTLQDKSIK
ncbi:MAG: DoxX family protein [Muribaculaceae bacterium]|nr:DoxX family protein [Muribaculaceae bacterium]